jgi:L-rhamnose mutarotase
MLLYPGREEEYLARHSPIWQEMQDVLKAHGVSNYSIFLDLGTHQLFGYAEIEDEARWQAIASTEICKKWWHSMKELNPSNPDNSPISRDLTEVFHLP